MFNAVAGGSFAFYSEIFDAYWFYQLISGVVTKNSLDYGFSFPL